MAELDLNAPLEEVGHAWLDNAPLEEVGHAWLDLNIPVEEEDDECLGEDDSDARGRRSPNGEARAGQRIRGRDLDEEVQ
jgi:hypothetical protein